MIFRRIRKYKKNRWVFSQLKSSAEDESFVVLVIILQSHKMPLNENVSVLFRKTFTAIFFIYLIILYFPEKAVGSFTRLVKQCTYKHFKRRKSTIGFSVVKLLSWCLSLGVLYI